MITTIESLTERQQRELFDTEEVQHDIAEHINMFWIEDAQESLSGFTDGHPVWRHVFSQNFPTRDWCWDEYGGTFHVHNVQFSIQYFAMARTPNQIKAIREKYPELTFKRAIIANACLLEIRLDKYGVSVHTEVSGDWLEYAENIIDPDEYDYEGLCDIFGIDPPMQHSGDNEWTSYASYDTPTRWAISEAECKFFAGTCAIKLFTDFDGLANEYIEATSLMFHMANDFKGELEQLLADELEHQQSFEYWRDMAIANEYEYDVSGIIDPQTEEQDNE